MFRETRQKSENGNRENKYFKEFEKDVYQQRSNIKSDKSKIKIIIKNKANLRTSNKLNTRISIEAERKDSNNYNDNLNYNKEIPASSLAKSNHFNNFNNNNEYENLNMFKTKTEFQKKLMSNSNINKYKQICLNLMKADEDIKKLNEAASINYQEYESFLEQILFSDKIFMFKLESFLSVETNNGKIKKEKFFKEEIKKLLDAKIFDKKYNDKVKCFMFNVESYINKIQNYDFIL